MHEAAVSKAGDVKVVLLEAVGIITIAVALCVWKAKRQL